MWNGFENTGNYESIDRPESWYSEESDDDRQEYDWWAESAYDRWKDDQMLEQYENELQRGDK